jgi:hypothetical protein
VEDFRDEPREEEQISPVRALCVRTTEHAKMLVGATVTLHTNSLHRDHQSMNVI